MDKESNTNQNAALQKLIRFFGSRFDLPEEIIYSYEPHLTSSYYPKSSILMSTGRSAENAWFVVSGLSKEFYYDVDGRQIVTGFCKEDEIILADNIFEPSGSQYYIQLLEDSELISLSDVISNTSSSHWPRLQTLALKIVIKTKGKSELRSHLLMLSAEEKYHQFRRHFPSSRISAKDIASYLHMSPVTLSKIRSSER